MNKILLRLALTITLIFSIVNSLNAQVFRGFSAFKELIEFEGQRYLMDEIYDVKSEDFDKLKIDKTIKEIDNDEGFMFVLTSYKFNDMRGIVITSLNSKSFFNDRYGFTNVHLKHNEYLNLYENFIELEENDINNDDHILRKFNERLIIDVNKSEGIVYFTLWVDNQNRHTFSRAKWDRALKRYKKYVE